MAIIYNPNLHHNYINDVPEPIVTKFLIKKGIVTDESKCHALYKIGGVSQLGFAKIKRITRYDFLKIFTRYIFVNVLIKVILTINKTGGTINTSKDLVD